MDFFLQGPIEESFFGTTDNTIPRVILIHSKSVQVDDAKFLVDKTFKSYIGHGHIFIHHECEDTDDIARWIACEHIVPSCEYLESIIESISETHLVSALDDAFNISCTRENIRKLCYEIFIQTKDETVGAVGCQSYVCRLSFNVQRLKSTLVKDTLSKTANFLGAKICSGILHHVETMVQKKIEEDLTRQQFKFSDEIHENIEISIRAIINSVFAAAVDFIISIGVFFITIIYPVDINSKAWRKQIADEIFVKIRDSRSTLKERILEKIGSVCSNTSDDLKYILANLTNFKLKVSSID